MPDGDEVPHLVDLQQPANEAELRNGANNQYWLYTRRNPTNHQLMRHNDANSVRNSYYNSHLPIKVIVHGWNSKGSSSMNPKIRDAFFAIDDFNVIVVDWGRAASGFYTTSVRAVPSVGQHLGHFLNWLIGNFGGNWSNVHLIGFSLGAHVVGNAGRTVGRRPARITGLDPAGPQWGGNRNALNRNDGVYVETIHTDGGLLGIFDPIADADFYPNGGRNSQPGCWNSVCSHGRAHGLFAASIRYDHFIGRQCSNLNEARNNRCNGRHHRMGNAYLDKRGYGLFGLSTGDRHNNKYKKLTSLNTVFLADMKLFVALSVLVALANGVTVPSTPGDNSHYVEGVSRYIWMPDGDGVPHLVDLQEPANEAELRNGANNQYWLYTRRNPTNHQLLRHNDANSVRNSNYNARLHTKVIVHGWNSKGSSGMNPMIRDAFLAIGDFNVIVVDWGRAASGIYSTSVRAVPGVGQHLGNFLNWLIGNFGGNWNNVHLIGFSLGAHVVGNAGRTVGRRPARITGLDPAGPQWGGNGNALNRNDGVYVETIHTDGGLLGIFDPIADADFYPNGGRNSQPGCMTSVCSHSRAYELFAASIRYDRFVGRQCSNLNEARNNRCNGGQHRMGNAYLGKRGRGLFGLATGGNWPF
ncbi:unnamed protein product [Leptosia nina]|uniref:Lipase domain-containing protein n=1 Tax=Leptosia nina TaxID=320188 RepID=A0AAV1J521_9NEOP